MGTMGMGGGMMPGGTVEPMEFPDDVAARCLLKISCDPSILFLDYRMMKHLWFSTGVLNKAYRDVLNDSNSLDCSGYILFINDAGAPAEVVYSVAVPVANNGKEREILAAAVKNLKNTLAQMGGQELDKLRDRLDQTDQRCSQMEKQVAEMQSQVRAITQQGVTNRQEVQKKIGDLMNRMSDSEMKLRYSDNRIHELRQQKADLQSAIEKVLAADTVIEELRNIIKGAEESVAMSEKGYAAGSVPADKVQGAREQLTRAKIEMAKRAEEVRANNGQKQLADIDDKIAATASQISEMALIKNFSADEYEKTKELLAKSDELELLEMKLDAAKRSFFETLNARENLKNRLQMQQHLSISVIGME